MKIFAAGALCFLIGVSSQASLQGAQDQTTPVADSAPASGAPSKIDAAKEADIRHLLEVAGTAAVVQQLMDSMEQSLKPQSVKALPPGEYRDRLSELFFEKFRSDFDTKRLMNMAVARYDENFSDQEIKGLISFYQTPLGHKIVTVLPTLTVELQQDGQRLGQQVGRDAMTEVLSEHPDIAQALQEASRRGGPAPH
jgi:uncharacterized protein